MDERSVTSVGEQLFSVKKKLRPCLYKITHRKLVRYIGEYDYISNIIPNYYAKVTLPNGWLAGAWQFKDTTRMWVNLPDDY